MRTKKGNKVSKAGGGGEMKNEKTIFGVKTHFFLGKRSPEPL